MTMHRKIQVIKVASLVVLGCLALYTYCTSSGGAQAARGQLIALCLAVVALALVCLYSLKVLNVDLPRLEAAVKAEAGWVAQRRWYVKGVVKFNARSVCFLTPRGWEEVGRHVPVHARDAAVLELNSADVERELLQLTLRQGHPSITHLQELHYLDIVEFVEVPEPLSCAVKADLCAYLVLAERQGSLE